MIDVRKPGAQLPASNTQAIRILNDLYRTTGQGNGQFVATRGVLDLGDMFLQAAIQAVRSFDAFTEDNDPWCEHDCATLEVQGERPIWKIDYYSPDFATGSENPADEALTVRVLTIMLASEY